MWRTGYLLGIHEVDEDHRVLFECLGSIHSALGTEYRDAVVFNTIERLSEYSRTHFRMEECLMRLFSYPELEAHQREHQAFIDKLDQLRSRLSDDNMARAMVDFLGRWLLTHIQHVDTRYVDYFRTCDPAYLLHAA